VEEASHCRVEQLRHSSFLLTPSLNVVTRSTVMSGDGSVVRSSIRDEVQGEWDDRMGVQSERKLAKFEMLKKTQRRSCAVTSPGKARRYSRGSSCGSKQAS
jgi:hypothetical protein